MLIWSPFVNDLVAMVRLVRLGYTALPKKKNLQGKELEKKCFFQFGCCLDARTKKK